MDYDAWQIEIVAALDALMANWDKTKGSKDQFFVDLGLDPGFHRDMRRRLKRHKQQTNRLPFDSLCKVFTAFGRQPIEVFYEAGRRVDPTLPELPRLQLGTPSSQLSQEILKELRAWAAEDSRVASPQGTSVEQMRGFCTWRRLHRLVLSEPCKVIDDARPALLLAEPHIRTRILAVVGTALRKTGDLDGAAHLIHEAIHQASVMGDLWAEAEATQRLSRVTLEEGKLEVAIEQAREAGYLYAEMGDRAGMGRALLSQGIYNYHLQRYSRAEHLYHAALRELPGNEHDNRFSAFINLALSAKDRGHLPDALRWLRAAAANSKGVADEMAHGSYQTRGAVAFELGSYEEAIDCFYRCRKFYLEAGIPLDAAYSTVWLFHALLETGRVADLLALTRESLELVGLLKGNPLAAGVMASLLRQLKAGKIRASELVGYRQRLEVLRKGARPDRRAPKP